MDNIRTIIKRMSIILKILIPLNSLFLLVMSILQVIYPKLMRSVPTILISFFKLQTHSTLTILVIIGISVLLYILYFKKSLLTIGLTMTAFGTVALFFFHTFFMQLPTFSITHYRANEQVLLKWEAAENYYTYEIEKGPSVYELEKVADTGFLMYQENDVKGSVYYRIKELSYGVVVRQSEVIESKFVKDTDNDLLNDDEEKKEQTNINLSDTDNDGLSDFLEVKQYHTNPLVKDSDSDGLDDYIEIYVGLNPLNNDSDSDGVKDDLEDSDEDTLSNKEELVYKTDLGIKDTDFDGLSDAQEKRYDTNPLLFDTDSDGISDGDEIDNHTNPLKVDSNGNGLSDGEEKIKKIISYTDIKTQDATVPSLEAQTRAKNQNSISLNPVEKELVFKNDQTPGYISRPFSLNSDEELSESKMTISLSPNIVNQQTAPTLYYIDDTSKELVEVSGQKLDQKNSKIEAIVTKPSIYVVLDKLLFEKAYQTDEKVALEQRPFMFVIDQSNSMSSNDATGLRFELTKKFVDQIHHAKGQFGVVTFADKAVMLHSLTTDAETVKNKVGTIINSGGTSGQSGIYEAIEQLKKEPLEKQKYIIFMTDGKDTASSKYDYQSLSKMAKENNIKIYTIGLGSVNESQLLQLANQTSGKYYHAETIDNLQLIYDSVGTQTTKKQPDILLDFKTKEIGHVSVSDRKLAFFATAAYNDTSTNQTLLNVLAKTPAYDDHANYIDNQFKNWTVVKQVSTLLGFSATVFGKGDTGVIAFRGSDKIIDWAEHLFYGSSEIVDNADPLKDYALDVHPQDVDAAQLLQKLINEDILLRYKKIYITGHSLGGRLALVFNGLIRISGPYLASKIQKTVTFNALGVKNVFNSMYYGGNNVNYFVPGEFLSTVLFGPKQNEKRIEVDSKYNTFQKHELKHFLNHPDVPDK